jgi:hypothetical protein
VASAVVSIALLSHAASTLTGHRLTKTEESRGLAIQTLRDFVERMRADEDWASLYGRLRQKADATNPGSKEPRYYALTDYYPDVQLASELVDTSIRVDVPSTEPAGGGAKVLREDDDLPAYGLPFDLNGDGAVDSTDRASDYRALPVVVTFRWSASGELGHSLRLTTWLRGER